MCSMSIVLPLQLVVVSIAKCCSSVNDSFWVYILIVATSTSCKRRDKLYRWKPVPNTLRCIEIGEVPTGRGLNQELKLSLLGLGILDGVNIGALFWCTTSMVLFSEWTIFSTANPTDFVNTKNCGYRFTRDAEFTFLGSLVDPKYMEGKGLSRVCDVVMRR